MINVKSSVDFGNERKSSENDHKRSFDRYGDIRIFKLMLRDDRKIKRQ